MMKLRSRILLTALAVLGAQAVNAQLTFQPIVTGLSSPIIMVPDPVDPTVMYVVQQAGRVRVIKNGVLQATDFINLSSKLTLNTPLGERGLLGMEFAPDYATSGYVYFNYSSQTGIGDTQISRFSRSVFDPLQADINSEYKILTVQQPFDNHNGGTLRFGPDGYLYIGMGDGGAGNDPGNRAQDPNLLLGKMLRIDVSQDGFPADPNRNYAIPPDNPFVDGNPIVAAGEIWDVGLRNPFKWSFDKASMGGTNALIIGDVGQDSWEEIDYEPAGSGGRNYGWRQREGLHDTGLGGTPAFLPFTDPIHEYPHGTGTSVTGGYVYRGHLLDGYQGRYFFADFIQKRLWSAGLSIDGMGEATVTDVLEHTTEVGGSSAVGNVSSIDIDRNGELYLLSFNGVLKRIIPSGPIEVAPTAFQVQDGLLAGGGLPEVQSSDDQYLQVRRWKNPAFGPHIQVIFTGVSPRLTTSQLDIHVEAHVTVQSPSQTLEAYNFAAGTWTALDTRNASITDQVLTISITNSPNSYIEPGTGRVRVRVGFGEIVHTVSRWLADIDKVSWTVNPPTGGRSLKR